MLVTGATGFLGGALARRLAAEGAHVRALARRPGRDAYIRDVPGITIAPGDITQPLGLVEPMTGCDYVFHVAVSFGSADSQWAVNVEGTAHVARAAAAARVKRLVHVSSIASYGYSRTGDIHETDVLTPGRGDPYSQTKATSELMLRRVASETGLDYAIIRPGMIYGPRSGQWTALPFRIASIDPVIFIGNGSGSAQPIHVDDVVDLMVLLASHPAATQQAFNCTPDPSPTWREWLLLYAQLAGHQNWFGVPPALVNTSAGFVSSLAPQRSAAKDAAVVVRRLQSEMTFTMDKARDLLGWQPQVTLADGVVGCADWLRQEGLLNS